MNSGDLQGAEREAKLALRNPSTRPTGSAALGAIRVRQKRYAEAIELLSAALQLNPRLVDARIILGEVYALSGKDVRARRAFNEVLRVDPHNGEAHFALAQLECASGNFHASLTLAEPILGELRTSPEGILLLAKDYAGLTQQGQLLTLVRDWEELQAAPANSSIVFSSLLEKSGLNKQALEVLEKAENSGQVSYEMAWALGSLYFANGDLSRAFGSYEAALGLNPNCTECLLNLAKIAMQQKDSEKALVYLIKAKQQQPNNAEILFEFGKTCLELDLVDDAISALQKTTNIQPNNDSYSYVLASANVSKKQFEKAGDIYQKLLAKRPSDPVLNYAMGSLLFLEGKLDEAATYLHRSVEAQPNQSAVYYYLGLIAEGHGENDKAIATLRDVVRRSPDYAPAYEAIGGILLKERKYSEAQQALDKAVLLNPDSVKAHYQLGILLGRTGRPEDADKEFDIVHQLNADEEKRLGMRLRILTPH